MNDKKENISAKIFILTGEWQDSNGKNILKFTGTSNELGTVEIKVSNNPVFFVERDSLVVRLNQPLQRKEVELKTFSGKPVDALYFNTQRDLKIVAEDLHQNNVTTYESDLDPARRYLMERFINAQVLVTGKQIKNNER